MARRRSSPFDDLLTVASKLPWKASLVLALVAFTALHFLSGAFDRPITSAASTDFGGMVIGQYIHVFATILQFVIPAGFLIGAAVSFIKRAKSASLLREARSSVGRDVPSLNWQEFESLVGEGFRQRGFQVDGRGGPSADGGIDLILRKGREKYLVQCKHWRAQQVGVSVVRELYGVMAAEQAAGGYVVTSGKFTTEALRFALGRNIELIGGTGLNGLLRERTVPTQLTAHVPTSTETEATTPPTCPSCRGLMIERVAKQGRNIGKSFWGCRDYPKCRGVMPMAAGEAKSSSGNSSIAKYPRSTS
jgi:restriction system protein